MSDIDRNINRSKYKVSVGGMSISKERGESDGQGQELSLHQAVEVCLTPYFLI